MKENDWKFRLLKWLGGLFGFLGVFWTMNPDGVITKLHFSHPEELEEPITSGWPIDEAASGAIGWPIDSIDIQGGKVNGC